MADGQGTISPSSRRAATRWLTRSPSASWTVGRIRYAFTFDHHFAYRAMTFPIAASASCQPMTTVEEATALALRLPGAEQKSHFGNVDFRVRNKVFASFPSPDQMTLRLDPEHARILVEVRSRDVRPASRRLGPARLDPRHALAHFRGRSGGPDPRVMVTGRTEALKSESGQLTVRLE